MALLKRKPIDLVPEGYHGAELKEVNLAEGANGEYLQWEFEVDPYTSEQTGEEVVGRRLRANSSLAFGAKSKARPWVENLSGKKLSPDAEVDTDNLIGLRAMLNVVHVPGKEEGEIFAQVKDVMKPFTR